MRPLLSERARQLLLAADRPVLAAAYLGSYALYHELHRHAAAFAPTDSFYVGFRAGADRIVYPYNWDGLEYDDPNVNAYAPNGLTARILTGGAPYRAAEDNGALLHRGRRFGDTRRRSEDAVAVAWPGARGDVAGIVAQLSYTPSVYDEEAPLYLGALVQRASTAAQRAREDAQRRRDLGFADAPDDGLARLRILAAELERDLDGHPLGPKAVRLRQACERLQTDASLARVAEPELLPLTVRERQVAAELVRGGTNREIGERLGIAELTVKTHVAAVIRKLGAGGRSGVVERLRGRPTPKE